MATLLRHTLSHALRRGFRLALVFAALSVHSTRAGEWDVRLLGDSAGGVRWLPPVVAGALAGHAVDERAIGSGYEWGDGLPQDYAAALVWYRRAAQHGSVAGMVDCGILIANGSGTAADPAAAVALFRVAATLGSAAAETRLGMAYEWGQGVEGSASEAVSHYRAALLRGDRQAAVYLALVQASQWPRR